MLILLKAFMYNTLKVFTMYVCNALYLLIIFKVKMQYNVRMFVFNSLYSLKLQYNTVCIIRCIASHNQCFKTTFITCYI